MFGLKVGNASRCALSYEPVARRNKGLVRFLLSQPLRLKWRGPPTYFLLFAYCASDPDKTSRFQILCRADSYSHAQSIGRGRSEERRVGHECVSTCSSGWSPYH